MSVSVSCAALAGVMADHVLVEVDVSMGLPAFSIVGLAEGAVRESKVRVMAALSNCGYAMPPRKVTVNLAPANLKKTGSAFDLAIALGLLAGVGLVPPEGLAQVMVASELGLDGRCRPVPGTLPYALLGRRLGCKQLLVASTNGAEAAVVDNIEVIPIGSLPEAVLHLNGESLVEPLPQTNAAPTIYQTELDMAEVRGQEHAKRALEVGAAGAHNVAMIGPPGSGKTMLARRLATILPPLSFEEMLEVSAAHSVLGLTTPKRPLVTTRPFRAPHHTVSDAGLVGGGNPPKPGEVSLSHNGVLFLDELPEFKRHVLEVLREPLEEGEITISRASGQNTFPATFNLIASMNPCPCGYFGTGDRACTCMPSAVERYRSKISGPLLDRIDIHIDVPAVAIQDLTNRQESESSAAVRQRVIEARDRQNDRFKRTKARANGQMSLRQINKFCELDPKAKGLVEKAIERLGLSARAYSRILKVARTIADLAGEENICIDHVAEAIGYRTLDRKLP